MEDYTSDRFEGHKFDGVYEWVVIHDRHKHPALPQSEPCIWLCVKTLRVRANDLWTKLPKEHKRVMVAHEIGHREYQHYLRPLNMMFRELALISGSVCDHEVQADMHSVKLTSKEEVIKVLEHWISRVTSALSKREFELRLEAVQTSAQVRREGL